MMKLQKEWLKGDFIVVAMFLVFTYYIRYARIVSIPVFMLSSTKFILLIWSFAEQERTFTVIEQFSTECWM